MSEEHTFSVWKTIEMGTECSIEELAHCTHIAGYGIPYNWYHGRKPAFFRGAPVAPCRSSVFPRDMLSLARVTPEDLGLVGNKASVEIVAAGQANGLQVCPLEAALQLRRQYGEDQPDGECLVMPTAVGYSFIIGHDDSEYAGEAMRESVEALKERFHVRPAPDIVWPDTSYWVFVQPRRKP